MNWRYFFIASFFFRFWIIAQEQSPLVSPPSKLPSPSDISKKSNLPETGELIDIPLFQAAEQQLNGVLASHDFNIHLPEHISFGEGSELWLSYRPSPLLLPELSTMTVLINGVKLHSIGIGNSENIQQDTEYLRLAKLQSVRC